MAVELQGLTGYAALKILQTNTGNTALEWVSSTGTGNVVRATSPTLVTPALGTPSSGTLTSCTGLPISTGVSGLGSGVATLLATFSSANLAAALTDETGSGANVFGTSPTLATPVINVGSDATGDIYYRNSGGAFTRLAIGTTGQVLNVGGSGVPVWATSSGGGNAQTANPLSQFASTTSSQLAGVMSDETGGGLLVFNNSPVLITPSFGSIVNSGTLTLPTSTDTLVGRNTTDTLVNKTLTSPIINVGSDATGDIYYRNSGGAFTRLPVGTNGYVLTLASGLPSWAASAGGGSSYDESNPILDSSSNELLKFTKVTSAVNEITVSNNSTGNAPIISATGGDTNIDLRLSPKGTGVLIAEAENGLQYRRSGVLKGTISAGWGGLNITMGGTSVDPATISVGAGGSVRVTVAGDNCGWSFHSALGIAFAPITQTQFTTNQDNLNLHNGVQRGGLHQRWSSDASRDVTGLVPQTTVAGGTTYTIWNVGSFNIVLKHDSASSTATNRILCSTGADLTLAPNGCALVMYDSVTTKWRATLLA